MLSLLFVKFLKHSFAFDMSNRCRTEHRAQLVEKKVEKWSSSCFFVIVEFLAKLSLFVFCFLIQIISYQYIVILKTYLQNLFFRSFFWSCISWVLFYVRSMSFERYFELKSFYEIVFVLSLICFFFRRQEFCRYSSFSAFHIDLFASLLRNCHFDEKTRLFYSINYNY